MHLPLQSSSASDSWGMTSFLTVIRENETSNITALYQMISFHHQESGIAEDTVSYS